jgi:metal-dependent amidase/aminoacylase/carboxypeptidase family protein
MYHYEPLYKNLRSDKLLNQYYQENFSLLGEKYTLLPDDFADGSTDVGNVSHVTRTCQPTICIGNNLFVHTLEFANASGSEYAKKQALIGAKAMAMTAIDVLFEK